MTFMSTFIWNTSWDIFDPNGIHKKQKKAKLVLKVISRADSLGKVDWPDDLNCIQFGEYLGTQ